MVNMKHKQTGIRKINHTIDTNYAWIIVLFCLDLFCNRSVGKINNPTISSSAKIYLTNVDTTVLRYIVSDSAVRKET